MLIIADSIPEEGGYWRTRHKDVAAQRHKKQERAALLMKKDPDLSVQ